MTVISQDPRDVLAKLAADLLDPERLACLGCGVVLVLLFATSLVRHRQPPPSALLGIGLLLGTASSVATVSGTREILWTAVAISCLLWLAIAMVVALAAVIQPGEPAPVSLGRAARHLGPAMLGTLLLGAYDAGASRMGLPLVLAVLPSIRPSPRVDRAWSTATVLVACHAGLAAGGLLLSVYFRPESRLMLAFEAWLAAQALFAGLELWRSDRACGLVPWVFSLPPLALVGALWIFPFLRQDGEVHWYALGRTLPRCSNAYSPLQQWGAVFPASDPPAWFSRPDPSDEVRFHPVDLYMDASVVVAGEEESLSSLLGRPFRSVCRGRYARYETVSLVRGEGVELRQVDGLAWLASGEPATPDNLQHAAQACRIEVLLAPRGEGWTAQRLVDWCGSWTCVSGRPLCTFRPDRGWHLEEQP